MKKFIFFLLLPLSVVVYIVYIYVYASLEKDKIYYFPQIELYLKVYKPPFNKYGYVIFSKDSVFSFSKDIDFLKVYKSETSSVKIIFNPIENKNIYIVDRWNNIKINQSDFIIKKIDRTDTIFFERKRITNTNNQTLKSKYFEIFIEGYLQSLFYIDYNIADTPIKAEPCSYSSLKWVRFKKNIKSILTNFSDKFFNFIASVFVFLTQSYFGALCFLLLGVFFIKKSLKDNNTDIISNYIRGWVAGVGSIILSFIILYIKLTGQI